MFDTLLGTISSIRDKAITLSVGGVGFSINVPTPKDFVLESEIKLFMHFHWSAENGPGLYGFAKELDRTVFLLIIDCPKIGPSLALSILSQMSTAAFLETITTGNEKALSSLNGIGSKKAELIIVELKHKVQKMLTNGTLVIEQKEAIVQWQQLGQVLTSLNYTKQEISNTINYLSEKHANQSISLDSLIRAALSHLSQKQA